MPKTKTKTRWTKRAEREAAIEEIAMLYAQVRTLRAERDELQRRVEDAESLNLTLQSQVEHATQQIESQHALLIQRNEQGNELACLVLDLFEIIALQERPAPQADLAQKLARAVGKVRFIRPFV